MQLIMQQMLSQDNENNQHRGGRGRGRGKSNNPHSQQHNNQPHQGGGNFNPFTKNNSGDAPPRNPFGNQQYNDGYQNEHFANSKPFNSYSSPGNPNADWQSSNGQYTQSNQRNQNRQNKFPN